MAQHETVELEQQGWVVLSSDAPSARTYYERVLDESPVMLLPGGMVLEDRAAIIDSMSGTPWSSYELEDIRTSHVTSNVVVVLYGVVAERDGQTYSALVSSTYVRREDGWKLTFHQQTPR